MAERVPARLSAAQGRKFGLTVGAAFVGIAFLLYFWRHAVIVPRVFGALGALLIAGGLLVPNRMAPVERAWMKLAHLISRVTTPILMGVIYFVVLSPVGIFRRMLGKNALVRKEGESSLSAGGFWFVREDGRTRSNLTRQF
jgi:hypothetical protein